MMYLVNQKHTISMVIFMAVNLQYYIKEHSTKSEFNMKYLYFMVYMQNQHNSEQLNNLNQILHYLGIQLNTQMFHMIKLVFLINKYYQCFMWVFMLNSLRIKVLSQDIQKNLNITGIMVYFSKVSLGQSMFIILLYNHQSTVKEDKLNLLSLWMDNFGNILLVDILKYKLTPHNH